MVVVTSSRANAVNAVMAMVPANGIRIFLLCGRGKKGYMNDVHILLLKPGGPKGGVEQMTLELEKVDMS